MKEEKNLPTREGLDHAFTVLQDQITRITVDEEEEQMQQEVNNDTATHNQQG